jgi:hypothetical protein
MPIIRRISLLNPKEPDLYTKLRRNTKVGRDAQKGEKDLAEFCEHEDLIDNWLCK